MWLNINDNNEFNGLEKYNYIKTSFKPVLFNKRLQHAAIAFICLVGYNI